MDIILQLRRLVANLLLESAARMRALAQLHPGSIVRPVFEALATERLKFAREILDLYEDPDLLAAITEDRGATSLEAAFEEARATAGQNDWTAAAVAIEAETRLSEVLEDLPADVFEAALVERLKSQVQGGLQRLIAVQDNTRNQGRTIYFGTKSMAAREGEPPAIPLYQVWYATNRAEVHRAGTLIGFSEGFGSEVTYGKCSVSIPETHRIGETKPSLWRRLRYGDRPLSLATVEAMTAGSFWADIGAALTTAGAAPGDAVVFLHGYNVSFESAAICAAQMGCDLGIPGGAMAFFSWPSRGRLLAYNADEDAIASSEAAIVHFLEQFVRQAGARRVHLLAHSMGNRGLLRAVNHIATQATLRTGKPFGQIILAAPDVDRRTFDMLHKAYADVADRTTLYVSERDVAVRTSRFLHAGDRVGLAPPVTVLAGIDTVNVTKIDLSLLGHGYISSCRTVLTDMHQLLVSGLEPPLRAGLTSRTAAGGTYWEVDA